VVKLNSRFWDSVTYERVLQKVKDVTLVPAPRESDEVDRLAAEYLRLHAGGKQHFLVYNGTLHRAAMFPSDEDFEVAALVSSMTYAQDASREVEFRIVQPADEQDTVVSYGFKGSVPATTESEACGTHPEYFLWPSDRFFIHHRTP
jgi:hypothetical protein